MNFTSNLLDGIAIGAPKATPNITMFLDTPEFPIPGSFAELMNSKGSFAGNSAVSEFLSCPERARLRSGGVKKRGTLLAPGDELNASGFGVLMHALLSIRVLHGMKAAIRFIGPISEADGEMWSYGVGLAMEDRLKSYELLKTYDAAYPLAEEGFQYIGVETEVVSDLSLDPTRPALRSARFDKLVRYPDGAIYSLEHKTSASGGRYAVQHYQTQFQIQGAIWNKNPHMVARYGKMHGVIPDLLIKTKTPKVERLEAVRFNHLSEQRVCEFMSLPERVKFPVAEDGSYPRMLNACYSRYGTCEYADGCWDGAWNAYEVSQSRTAAPISGEMSSTA